MTGLLERRHDAAVPVPGNGSHGGLHGVPGGARGRISRITRGCRRTRRPRRAAGTGGGERRRHPARPDTVGELAAGPAAVRRGRRPCLRARHGKRPLPGDGLSHPRRDGRYLDTAAQAARWDLVRPQRPVDRPGDQVHVRLRVRADGPARNRRGPAVPDRLRARRPPCGRDRADPHRPVAGRAPEPERGRPLRADERLPMGLHHAGPDHVQPAGQGGFQRAPARLHRGRDPAGRQRRTAPLGRGGRSAARRIRRSSARSTPSRTSSGATTPPTARARAGS
jgi:hypothetical protein